MIAIVQDMAAPNQITIYRDGEAYEAYTKRTLGAYTASDEAVIGPLGRGRVVVTTPLSGLPH